MSLRLLFSLLMAAILLALLARFAQATTVNKCRRDALAYAGWSEQEARTFKPGFNWPLIIDSELHIVGLQPGDSLTSLCRLMLDPRVRQVIRNRDGQIADMRLENNRLSLDTDFLARLVQARDERIVLLRDQIYSDNEILASDKLHIDALNEYAASLRVAYDRVYDAYAMFFSLRGRVTLLVAAILLVVTGLVIGRLLKQRNRAGSKKLRIVDFPMLLGKTIRFELCISSLPQSSIELEATITDYNPVLAYEGNDSDTASICVCLVGHGPWDRTNFGKSFRGEEVELGYVNSHGMLCPDPDGLRERIAGALTESNVGSSSRARNWLEHNGIRSDEGTWDLVPATEQRGERIWLIPVD